MHEFSQQVKKVLGANPLVMTLPIGREDEFTGVVDVLTQKAYIWDDSGQYPVHVAAAE